jgi:hypothetical protein
LVTDDRQDVLYTRYSFQLLARVLPAENHDHDRPVSILKSAIAGTRTNERERKLEMSPLSLDSRLSA